MSKFLLFLFLLLPALWACAPKVVQQKINASCSSRVSVIYSEATEPAYCSSPTSYINGVTITGQATFENRPYTNFSGLGSISAPLPIRYAEVAVYNSGGSRVQCGHTDGTGNFSLSLPSSSSSHTIRIFSRADNAFAKVSVLNCPEENLPYSISKTTVPDNSKSIGSIHATADNSGEILGGAFNIYDQIVLANDFLRSKLGTCPFTGCEAFTVAPKVQAYWVKGFNPNDYDNGGSGVSFYVKGYRRLFILGGIDGDIFHSDTDHFDNSIILHEYGHFLEDVFTHSDSPGGAHGGNAVIDPRLALSEAWGNFIQAAIRNQARYRDTEGTPNANNPTSNSSYIFNIPLENPNGTCNVGSTVPGCDIPAFDYEGNFREYSITRLLWDIYDGPSNPDSVNDEGLVDKLSEVWTIFTSSLGFKKSSAAFRNVGLLHEMQSSYSGMSDWSSVVSSHKHGDSLEYARHVTRSGGCGKTYNMNPYQDSNDNGTFATSHLLRNNNFYHYRHPGGSLQLTLKYQTIDVGSDGYLTELEPDLDVYIYNSNARFGNSTDIVGQADTFWDNDPNTEETESLSLPSLAAGDYLINVKVFTGRFLLDNNNNTNNCIGTGFRRICENDPAPDYNFIPAGDDVSYELIVNGVNLCPAPLP